MNVQHIININGRWLCCLLLFAACNTKSYNQLQLSHEDSVNLHAASQKAYGSIENSKSLIRNGDMILRTGNDFTSESLRQFSLSDKTYSHCGIASVENDTVFVYHALGGEWNPDERLRRDRIELFCNPEENRGFGVFTFNFPKNHLLQLDSIVRAWYKKGVMFDMKFDLVSDDRLYCAEFVSKAITIASAGSINFATTRINDFEFIAVDNLFLNKYCSEKQRVRYK